MEATGAVVDVAPEGTEQEEVEDAGRPGQVSIDMPQS